MHIPGEYCTANIMQQLARLSGAICSILDVSPNASKHCRILILSMLCQQMQEVRMTIQRIRNIAAAFAVFPLKLELRQDLLPAHLLRCELPM